jgi:hypothetical protein
MCAGGKRPGAGRPKGSKALTLIAPTGERMPFYEAARQHEQKALQVIGARYFGNRGKVAAVLAAEAACSTNIVFGADALSTR